jgi:DNA-binding response OmpR family regulator
MGEAVAGQTILVVEDERSIAEAIRFNLERNGYVVRVVHDGREALTAAETAPVDLIVLDVMLPGIDGLEVCRRIRARSMVPILMLTAKAEEVDRVVGLELGADDYLTKPFSLRELLARVRALLRRASASGAQVVPNSQEYTAGDLRVSASERRAWRGRSVVHLRPREFDLLVFLMDHRGLALSRQQILDAVWGNDYAGDERTVDVHVRALREAIEDNPAVPRRIVTVRGVGYRFEG